MVGLLPALRRPLSLHITWTGRGGSFFWIKYGGWEKGVRSLSPQAYPSSKLGLGRWNVHAETARHSLRDQPSPLAPRQSFIVASMQSSLRAYQYENEGYRHGCGRPNPAIGVSAL